MNVTYELMAAEGQDYDVRVNGVRQPVKSGINEYVTVTPGAKCDTIMDIQDLGKCRTGKTLTASTYLYMKDMAKLGLSTYSSYSHKKGEVTLYIDSRVTHKKLNSKKLKWKLDRIKDAPIAELVVDCNLKVKLRDIPLDLSNVRMITLVGKKVSKLDIFEGINLDRLDTLELSHIYRSDIAGLAYKCKQLTVVGLTLTNELITLIDKMQPTSVTMEDMSEVPTSDKVKFSCKHLALSRGQHFILKLVNPDLLVELYVDYDSITSKITQELVERLYALRVLMAYSMEGEIVLPELTTLLLHGNTVGKEGQVFPRKKRGKLEHVRVSGRICNYNNLCEGIEYMICEEDIEKYQPSVACAGTCYFTRLTLTDKVEMFQDDPVEPAITVRKCKYVKACRTI